MNMLAETTVIILDGAIVYIDRQSYLYLAPCELPLSTNHPSQELFRFRPLCYEHLFDARDNTLIPNLC